MMHVTIERMYPKYPIRLIGLLLALLQAACGSGSGSNEPPPNILFVIMDDVGIDQMASFGYGGSTPPPMPNIDAVADAGIRFRNTWSMPECSPGRAAFFVGRYPLRTHMYQALGPNDLANSQLSQHDVTVPMLLKQAGYENAMFGKFHLAGPEHNEAGNATPAVLGWDYFYGWIGGLPGSIDTTAGGVYETGEWSCGYYPHHFAGACHYADGSCVDMAQPQLTEDATGLQCLADGGIFVDHRSCSDPLPAGAALDFDRENAYYVSPLVIVQDGEVEEVPLRDARARGYRTTIETDAAIEWIKARASSGRPWMATVSYSAAHTPWQIAPKNLSPQANPQLSGDILDCASSTHGRFIQNQMTEAMDTEFGRLLVETGLASRSEGGRLVYDPKASNTVIVIVGDNGSLGFAVKLPFDPTLAKGTSYQTGVWVPLAISGPMVTEPGREVEHMVNAVDLFELFGQLAGVDVHAQVPRVVDSAPLLPYLTDSAQPSLRRLNFAQSGVNIQADNGRNGPCVISRTETDGGSCTQIPTSKSVCEDNSGVWWGAGYTDASVVANGGEGYANCWQVNQAIHTGDPGALPVSILPERTAAIRNEHYKLVQNLVVNYDSGTDSAREDVGEELYEVDQAKATDSTSPKLEDPDSNDLLKQPPLSAEAQSAYRQLRDGLDEMLASEVDCPGDGNRDGVVDQEDLAIWQEIAERWGLSSVYDFAGGTSVDGEVPDGYTDASDQSIILSNQDRLCENHGFY